MSSVNGSNHVSQILIGLLGVMFVGLKLSGVINWSWWWVTLPFWGGFALLAVFAIITLIIVIIKKINL